MSSTLTHSSTLTDVDSSIPAFSLGELRRLVRDLKPIMPAIYWIDFLTSMLIGYASAWCYLHSTFGIVKVASFLVSGFAIYRLSTFIHEIVHFPGSQMRSFRIAWNLFAGVPLLMPSFFYQHHLQHHSSRHYGTTGDGEYLPLGTGTWRLLALFVLQVFVQPIFVAIRFAIITPISFLRPSWRRKTLEYASSFVINLRHRRELPKDYPRLTWAAMEVLCCLRIWVLIVPAVIGVTEWTRIPHIYLLAVFILSMNHFRTLLAHRYLSDGDRPMSQEEQLLDSVDITGDPVITELICPLSLRYHALHHLVPSIPYHNLGIAHRRLMHQLPETSPYRNVVRPNLLVAFRDLLASISRNVI